MLQLLYDCGPSQVVNSYQNGSVVVFDAVTWQDASTWIIAQDVTKHPCRCSVDDQLVQAFISVQTNKQARDALARDCVQHQKKQIWRYIIHMSGPDQGKVGGLASPACEHDTDASGHFRADQSPEQDDGLPKDQHALFHPQILCLLCNRTVP